MIAWHILLRPSRHFRVGLLRLYSSSSVENKLVLGCGSNVVDHFYNVKAVPRPGEKGFFLSPFRVLEKKLVGGVTLNHLCWTTMAGVPAALLALQGQDDLGYFIRREVRKLGVATDFIKVDSHYTTAQCHVFIQENGERSIVMAPAATSLINSEAVQKHFDAAIQQHASMVTTEISQVPLSGVLALLKSAKRANVLSVLDVDISPSVAVHEAMLGDYEELLECVKCADVLKLGKVAAEELLVLLNPSGGSVGGKGLPLTEIARELVRLCHPKLVAITDGSQSGILANTDSLVDVAPPPVEKVVDATGAGDAFLGGLIVGITESGLPRSEEDMRKLATTANAYGATCVQSVGGVPSPSSLETLQRYLPNQRLLGGTLANGMGTRLQGFASSIRKDMDAVAKLPECMDGKSVSSFVDYCQECPGQLLVSGIGKSGLVAQRFSGSLSSVGILSHYVHAAEWVHGDLGKARPGKDVVIFLSNSGNTNECVTAATHLIHRGITVLAITGNSESRLSKLSTVALNYDSKGLKEPLDCVPTTSILIQELLCNAILCELISRREITREVFKLNHPGGSIGNKLKEKKEG